MECVARGLEVPRHMSVTGYNDLEIASAIEPSITTVQTPYEAVAVAAIDYLLAEIDGKPRPILAPETAKLVIRESIGTPRPRAARR